MSIFVKGGRAAQALNRLRKRAKPLKVPAAVMGTGVAIGASAGYESAQPGLKHQAMKEGAVSGLIGGAALVLAPKVGRSMASSGMRRARKAARKGKVVFRRIRGRIIPIRTK